LSSTKRLLVILASGSALEKRPANLAFRYASTAAALDLSVEIHMVGESVKLLQNSPTVPARVANPAKVDPPHNATSATSSDPIGFSERDFLSQIRDMKAMEVKLFACSAALAEAGLTVADLIPEVDGVRGAAALLVAGLADDTRLMTF
jgi:peroxiredoxin family protein